MIKIHNHKIEFVNSINKDFKHFKIFLKTMDLDSDINDIASISSQYELELEEEVEQAEEFKNQFYKGLEAEDELFETSAEETKEKINPDEDDEDINDYIDEIDGTKFEKILTPSFEELSDSTDSGKSVNPKNLTRNTLQDLAPVKLTEEKVLDLYVSESPILSDKLSYINFLHQEIGESKEMYRMRASIANKLSLAEIPAGNIRVVGLDAPGIIMISRMITNKLWFGMRYNKEQEELISELIKYTPDIKF